MPAYLIVHSKLTNPIAFQQYVEASEQSLNQYSGKYLLGGLLSTVLEGEHDKNRTVIFQFPSTEHAKQWYNSEEYLEVKHLRKGHGDFDFLLIESF